MINMKCAEEPAGLVDARHQVGKNACLRNVTIAYIILVATRTVWSMERLVLVFTFAASVKRLENEVAFYAKAESSVFRSRGTLSDFDRIY
jgi:hypothetical protein